MWKLIVSAVLFLGSEANANTHSSVRPINFNIKVNASSICDSQPPTIEAEMCCDFPDFFFKETVGKCEHDFGPPSMATDSVIYLTSRHFQS